MLVMAIHGFRLFPSFFRGHLSETRHIEAHQTEDGIFSLCFTKHHTFFFSLFSLSLSLSSFGDQQIREMSISPVNFRPEFLHNPSCRFVVVGMLFLKYFFISKTRIESLLFFFLRSFALKQRNKFVKNLFFSFSRH